MANPAIVVDFVADTKDLSRGFNDASGKASGFSSKLKGVAKAGAFAAGAAGIAGLTAAVKIGIDEFKEASKVGAQTKAVIKSTGGVAKVSAGHVDTLATSLMKKSGVDDEAVASGENVLLTFTNIRNEVGKGNDIFDQATTAALDMSVALGTDMKDASMNLGKALNSPVEGMNKLKRSGVTFTDAQKKQVEAMVKAGDTAGAQKIILEELNKEFGGSAEAAGKTLPGQISILKESFSNLAGEMVGKLIPVLQSAITWLRDHWPEISAALQSFWTSVKPILDNLWDLLKAVAQVVIDNWPLISPILEVLWKNVQNMAAVVATAIKLVTDLLSGEWAKAWQDAKQLVSLAITAIKDRITGSLTILLTVATALGSAILKGVQAGVSGLAGWIAEKIRDVRDAITDLATSVYNAAKNLGGKILSGIINGAAGLWTDVRAKVSDAVTAVESWFESAYNKAEQLGGKIKAGILAGVTGVAKEMKEAVGKAINAVIDLWNGLKFPGFKIPGTHKKIGGFGTPNIPHVAFAAGGIVTRPTMALVGEAGPEAVVPLTGGGSSSPIEVRVFIGDTELRGLVRAEVVDVNTGIARTLLAGGVA